MGIILLIITIVSQTSENTGLCLNGPFSDLQGIYRYNPNPKNTLENCLEAVDWILTILDSQQKILTMEDVGPVVKSLELLSL